jgi:hypothetical protein
MPSDKGIDALNNVRDVIASSNLPFIQQRKFNGIFNALEMQIEDDDCNRETFDNKFVALPYVEWKAVWNRF